MQFKNTFLLLFIVCLGTTVYAQKYLSTGKAEVSKEWEGNNFSSSKTFTENIAEATQFTVLSKVLKNDPLRESLENKEMVTIFAITDSAFMELPKKRRDSILGNTKLMHSLVKYLTVPGRIDSNSLQEEVRKNGGRASVKTLEGQTLGIKENNGQLQLIDSENRTATVIATDFYHKNGFFHIVSGLIFPTMEE